MSGIPWKEPGRIPEDELRGFMSWKGVIYALPLAVALWGVIAYMVYKAWIILFQ